MPKKAVAKVRRIQVRIFGRVTTCVRIEGQRAGMQIPSAQVTSVTNLSVPIIGPLGTVMAVITCPYTTRLDKAGAPDMAEARDLVREAAAAISRRT